MSWKVVSLVFGCCLLATSSNGLENICKQAGVFPHPEDCSSFITCHGPRNSEFKMTTHLCPNGQAFSSSELICQPLEQNPDCEQSVFARYDPYASDPACAGQTVHCANCSHLVFCQFIGNEYLNPQYENCAFEGSMAPYCDEGSNSCSSLLPPGCDKPGFVCTSSGFFPDPDQCDIYHVCYDSSNYESFRCGEQGKPEYKSEEFRCGASNVSDPCQPVDCSGILGVTEYPNDPRYFMLCMSAGRKEIYACPGNTVYVPELSGCAFVCQEEGLFAVVDDCYSYNRCEISVETGELEATKETCPEPLAFNPISGSCDAAENAICVAPTNK